VWRLSGEGWEEGGKGEEGIRAERGKRWKIIASEEGAYNVWGGGDLKVTGFLPGPVRTFKYEARYILRGAWLAGVPSKGCGCPFFLVRRHDELVIGGRC